MNSCKCAVLEHPIELGRKLHSSDICFIWIRNAKHCITWLQWPTCEGLYVFYWSFCRGWRRRSSPTGLSTVDSIDRSFWLPCCSCSWLAVFSNYAFPSGVQWLSPLVIRLLPFHTSVMFCQFPFGTLHVSLTHTLNACWGCSPYSLLWTHGTMQMGSPAFVSLMVATFRHAKVATQHVQ